MLRKSRFTLVIMAILLMVGMLGIQPAKPVMAANPLRISQVYGGGGLVTSTFMYDFIEIYNSGTSAVSLEGMSIQYASATGTGNFGSAPEMRTELPNIMLGPGQYYLIQEAGGRYSSPLPTPDLTDATPIVMDATSGKVALVTGTTTLGCNGSATNPCPADQLARIVDLVGYGTANFYEGTAAAPAPSIITAAIRKDGGCTDTDDNAVDFEALSPTPRNTASPTYSCGPVGPLSPVINEFSANTTGTDVEYVEFFGSPNTDYSAYTLLGIEGDANSSNSSEGLLDNIIALGTTDANGFLLVSLDADTLENGTLSLLLVKDSTATTGVDIDTNDDGVIDMTYWSEITDGVAVNDGGTGDLTYATPVLGVAYDGLLFAPGGASRIPDGTDTDTTADWVRNDFDLAGIPGYPGTIALGEAYNTPGAPNQIFAETAPTVVSTIPADGANHPNNENITITFSEPVDVTDTWFNILCTTSGTHTAVVTDADPVYTLNPDVDFTIGETCTVTIIAANVVDDDLDDDEYDAMLADYTFTFTAITPPEGCGDEYTPIYTIQGTGETSPLAGTALATEGVVVGDFQTGGKNGYYIQDVTGDGNPATSDGIFVYNTSTAVNVGDHVRVRGTAVEYFGITEISPVTQVWICSTGNIVAATEVTLPVAAVSDFEKYESMLVTFPQSLIISEYFNFDRFGEIVLTSERHMTPTAFVEPGTPAQAEAQAYLLDRITLDDGRTAQNPDPAIHPNGDIFDMDNLFRGGGTVTDATGILDFYQGLYRLQPTMGAIYEDTNPRTEAPEITEADLKVASFNVLNYFVTLDGGSSAWICGPSGDMECRGADNAEEFGRQRAKILSALDAIDADVFGLMEIENEHSGGGDAVADLVAGLNLINGEGTYSYINTGAIGGDVIKQAILYKPAAVTPVGAYDLLDSSVDPRFIDTLNRPVLAQVFMDNVTGEEFVVAVNHLKSKGSACTGDPDTGDGQGNCNLTRKAAAQAMVDWLADPTVFPDVEKTLIIGDLNSYDKEDPIDMIKLGSDDLPNTDDDYLDMIFEKQGDYAYGYVYDGQTGYLDHALANLAMAASIVDVNIWHINADEPDLIDYDMSFKADAQDLLYAPDAYRSSDHDPVIITLNMNASPVAQNQEVTTAEDTPIDITLIATDTDSDPLTYAIIDQPTHGSVVLVDDVATYTPDLDYYGSDSFTFTANDGISDSNIATVTITVNPVDDAPVLGLIEDATIPELVEFSFTATATDADLPAQVLTFSLVDAPEGAAITSAGVFTWTPTEAQGAGVYTFTVKVCDDATPALCDEQEVTLTVTEVNVAPVLGTIENATIPELVEFSFTATATDADLPAQVLTFSLVDAPEGAEFDAETGIFTWTPSEEQGPGEFTFTVVVCDDTDPTPLCDEQEVTLTVTEVNAAPIAQDLFETTLEDTPVDVTLVATDAEDDVLTYAIIAQPTHGTVTLDGTTATYTPELDFNGTDTFTYKANDGTADSNIATVTITVTEVKDQVEAVDDFYTTDANTTLTVEAPGVLANDIDVDNNIRAASLVTNVQHGELSLLSDGSFTYVPDPGFFGTDTFVYQLVTTYPAPQSLWTDEATVTITVQPLMRLFLPIILR